MERVVAILQARMNSTRLPGKTLMEFGGKTLIEHVYSGVLNSKLVDEIVIAIPDSDENLGLRNFLSELGINYYAGSDSDVLQRYVDAAQEYDADFIVRVPADNPLPHGSEIDRVISFHLEHNRDGFSSNLSQVGDSKYPDGIGGEVFSNFALKSVNSLVRSNEQREHVHLNFFNYVTQVQLTPEVFPVMSPLCPVVFARPDIVLDINTPEDLKYFQVMFDYFVDKTPHITEIIPWHDTFGNLIRGDNLNSKEK
jgi:spore coat polysaccharide biosynthesis protein SpsF